MKYKCLTTKKHNAIWSLNLNLNHNCHLRIEIFLKNMCLSPLGTCTLNIFLSGQTPKVIIIHIMCIIFFNILHLVCQYYYIAHRHVDIRYLNNHWYTRTKRWPHIPPTLTRRTTRVSRILYTHYVHFRIWSANGDDINLQGLKYSHYASIDLIIKTERERIIINVHALYSPDV